MRIAKVSLVSLFLPFLVQGAVAAAETVSATTTISATACVSPATVCISPATVCQKIPTPGRPIENLTITTQGAATIIINSNVTLTNSNLSTSQTVSPAAEKAAVPSAPGAPPKEVKEEKKPYDELIKDATKQVGLFTVFTKKDKVLWEIRPEQFDTDYLLTAKIGQGVGTLFPGAILGSKVLNLRRVEDKIQIIERHPRYQADPKSPIRKAVDRAYGESIIASFPLAATNPATNSSVIDVQPFLLSDFAHLGTGLQTSLGPSYSFDKDNSKVEKLKVFPENIEIYAKHHFKSGQPAEVKALADASSARVLLRLSFRLLPKSNFQPRLADDRVGHFIEAHQDFSDLESRDRYVRYVTRWHIEKATPEAELSPPKQPLVFWIENTVPHEYRQAVKEGVERWNKAFEAAGFKNAVEAKQMPDDADWDPEDSRYHMVHWDTVEGLGFAGVGQWICNPLNGEILDCDVVLDGDVVRYLRRWRRFVEPIRGLPEGTSPERCQYGLLLAQETQLALAVLAARGEIGDGTETVEEFVKNYLRDLACHEVGHVLGLRHNFKASAMLKLDQLHDRELTAKKGLAASVMDYNPINLAPKGKPQGFYFNPCVGPYDCWAIEYAYRPLSATEEEGQGKELDRIASRCKDPDLMYLTDEDLWVPNPFRPLGLDPTNVWFDLSSETVAWDEEMMGTTQDAWKDAPTILKENESYYDVRNAVGMFLGYYGRYATDMARYIGGAYVSRSRAGSADGRLPMEPVPASTERHVMEVLAKRVFSDEPFQFDPKMLNMMINERWLHWGMDFYNIGRTDYPLHDVLLRIRRNVLTILFDPLVLSRVREAEQRIPSGQEAYTIPDLFGDLTKAIWGDIHGVAVSGKMPNRELSNTNPLISSHRRALQREYVRMLVNLMLTERGETPEDARTHAWNSLTTMKEDIDRLLSVKGVAEKVDQYSLVHLKETAATIIRALEARLEVRVG